MNVLNLIEGDAALVESTDGSFEPYEVHYGGDIYDSGKIRKIQDNTFGK